MTARASSNAFEHVDEADEIAGNIFVRTGNRTPYPGLRCQMNNGFEIAVVEKALHPALICQIQGEKPEPGPDAELSQPRILEPGVVVVVQVVYTYDLKPIRKKPVNEVRTYETSSTGDQNSLVSCLFRHLALSSTANVSQLPHWGIQ